jgi:hypothetical protein
VPECRGYECGDIISEARLLSGHKGSIVNVVFEPQMNLMIPVLHHDLW